MSDSSVDGFLNLNKPAGFTSHDCVAKVRRLFHQKRVGHAGTLDPAATGVLPIALGRATRLLQFLPSDKAYRAVIRLGIQTSTDDLEGEILQTQSAAHLDRDAVEKTLQQFCGVIQQIPPNYSAVQVKGKRLYDLARSGQAIAVPPRQVEIFSLEMLDWRPGEQAEVAVAIACGSGTYIRAIARDLGNLLQVGGTLASLLRTESCGFSLTDSLTLEGLEEQIRVDTFQPIAPEKVLQHLPAIALDPDQARRWCQGQRISLDPLTSEPSEILRVHQTDAAFLGIGRVATSDLDISLIPHRVFT